MINVKGLHARYAPPSNPPPTGGDKGGGEALRGLDLEIKPGRIYALLGPNGAGKTTFLRCLTGLLRPASGSLRVLDTELQNGFPPELFGRMGVLMESPNGYNRMTAAEYLRFFAGFYTPPFHPPPSGGDRGGGEARIKALAAAFELESLDTRIGKLSQGNKRKVQLMRSLLHRPELILWDEPTEHLDPRAQRLALSFLRRAVSSGAAALVTSHRLEQMEEMADDFGFLKRGLLVHALTREDSVRNMESAEIEGSGTLDPIVVENFSTRPGSLEILAPEQLRLGSWGLRIRTPSLLTLLPEMITALAGSGARILRVEPHSRSLADLYRHYVEDAP